MGAERGKGSMRLRHGAQPCLAAATGADYLLRCSLHHAYPEGSATLQCEHADQEGPGTWPSMEKQHIWMINQFNRLYYSCAGKCLVYPIQLHTPLKHVWLVECLEDLTSTFHKAEKINHATPSHNSTKVTHCHHVCPLRASGLPWSGQNHPCHPEDRR